MRFISKIYACYYFFYVAQNKFLRPTIFKHHFNDTRVNTFWLLAAGEFILLFDILLLISIYLHIHVLMIAIISIITFTPLFIFQQKQLISNRENQRVILENFRELSKTNKLLWNILGSFLIVVPLISLLLILYFI